jgi:hypothetical protein
MGLHDIRFPAIIYYNNIYLYRIHRIRVSFRTVKFQISIVFFIPIFLPRSTAVRKTYYPPP